MPEGLTLVGTVLMTCSTDPWPDDLKFGTCGACESGNGKGPLKSFTHGCLRDHGSSSYFIEGALSGHEASVPNEPGNCKNKTGKNSRSKQDIFLLFEKAFRLHSGILTAIRNNYASSVEEA